MIAAIYARKSTEQSGVADEQKSVARQIEHARQYAARKGWNVADEHVYVDDGISGAEFANRPGFLRLMNALKPRPRFDVLVMSEESRLGREMIQTAAALREITRAGVRVFFYLEDRERTLSTPAEKFMMSATAFADELERDKARQRVHDTMRRKFEQRHVTGGQCFGYRNVDVTVDGSDGRPKRQYVRREIHPQEAATVRRIFELCAAGEGLKGITKRLNAEHAGAPRSQRGRPRAWAPSSVRAILHREAYRGVLVWNRTRKRNSDGEKKASRRPSTDWMRLDAPDLRIVSEDLWTAAHGRLTERRENYKRFTAGHVHDAVLPAGSGPRTHSAALWTDRTRGERLPYLLSGFARCAACGGSIQAVSRQSTTGRLFRYVCGVYVNRGCDVCGNRRMADMRIANAAIHDVLRNEVLNPRIVERALDAAVEVLRAETRDDASGRRRAAVMAKLSAVDVELTNLAETAARGGAVPVILDALNRKDAERRALAAELVGLEQRQPTVALQPRALRKELSEYLSQWETLTVENVRETRTLLESALRSRIVFRPVDGPNGEAQYELEIPLYFDRILTRVLPELRRVSVASPTG